MRIFRVFAFILLAFCWSFIIVDIVRVKQEKVSSTEQTTLSIWQIDTFEGGVGSRRKFLFDVASKFEKKNPGVLIMVTNYTLDGVYKALEKGNKPDIISYGCGVEIDGLKELNVKTTFSGGKIGKKTFAVPWCKGCYVLISKNKNLPTDKCLDNLIVSQGEYTQPLISLMFNGYTAQNVKIYQPQYAFSEFICGKSNYFVGTQRDAVRLTYKDYNYSVYPLNEYNDLYQYLSITAEEKKLKICNQFCSFILSEEIQKTLKNIKLFSDVYKLNYEDESYINIEKTVHKKTLSTFTERQIIKELQEYSLRAILGNKDAYFKIEKIIL